MANIPNAAENPFQQLINASGGDPEKLQTTYEDHRTDRNRCFNKIICQPGFCEWKEDEILYKVLEAENGLTNYVDTRNNLAFWARPPQHVRDLVLRIQQQIESVIGPGLWLVPSDNLHMTTLEIRSEIDKDQIECLIETVVPKKWQELANYTFSHRARLVRPIINYDTSAIALSFVPAAGEDNPDTDRGYDDGYTYHHLRRDLYNQVTTCGVTIAARYTVPSAHITIARFVKPLKAPKGDLQSPEISEKKATQLVAAIEDLNTELRSKVWRRLGDQAQGQWIVGHEKGLELMFGSTWYGQGESFVLGEGFT